MSRVKTCSISYEKFCTNVVLKQRKMEKRSKNTLVNNRVIVNNTESKLS